MLPPTTATGLSRRRLLSLGLGAATLIAARPVLAATAIAPGPRTLSFENLHTGEKLSTVYWDQGEYSWEGLRRINHILRDFRTDEVFPIDANLLEVLNKVDAKLGGGRTFGIISGYRSPKTNEMLRASDSSGVAKKSMHMMGQAIDIRVKDVDLAYVRQTAINLKTGGVGYYSKSQFVHLDIGAVRSW